VQPAGAENLIPSAGPAFVSCTGRAVSVRRSGAPPAGTGWPGPRLRLRQADATILIVGAGCWPSASRAIAAVAGRGIKAVVSAELDDFLRYNLIKTGIVPAHVDRETVAALQALVESHPGILLTVDIGRREVRAYGDLATRFGIDDGAEDMARRLQMAQRLLGSAGLGAGTRIRLQRRLIAICDAMKSPRADPARGAWRLDLLLADIARSCETARTGAARSRRGASAARNYPFP
jgi:hypothetical protein